MSKIDFATRNRLMQRSKMLGVCVCDPKRRCPCDIFVTLDICPCAGEKPAQNKKNQIKLTESVHNLGCASKIPALELEHFLAKLPKVKDPAVISGLPSADDAAVYKINRNTTLVQTVDVFTPCVDDPVIFGKICAANCLSDIYAMGGVPKTALSVLAFPSDTLDGNIMYLMLKGAMEVFKTAGCVLLGGHSIKDEEIKLGFAITGTIEPSKVVAFETAKAGDMLVLTKPLGTGVLNFASQIGRIHKQGLKVAQRSMMALNKKASEVMVKVGVSACTDITGFGLFGHLARMVRHSGVSARIYADALPAFPGVMQFLRDDVIPGAIERNIEFVASDISVACDVSEEQKNLGFCAETSGGLLIAVPQKLLGKLVKDLQSGGVAASVIGEIKELSGIGIELVLSHSKPWIQRKVA